MDQNLACYFFTKILEKEFLFVGKTFLTRGVFVTQLSTNATITLTNCVGYDKLLFKEYYVVLLLQGGWRGNIQNPILSSAKLEL